MQDCHSTYLTLGSLSIFLEACFGTPSHIRGFDAQLTWRSPSSVTKSLSNNSHVVFPEPESEVSNGFQLPPLQGSCRSLSPQTFFAPRTLHPTDLRTPHPAGRGLGALRKAPERFGQRRRRELGEDFGRTDFGRAAVWP